MNMIFLAAIVIAVLYAIGAYNKMVSLAVRIDEAWSDIEVQLKRRYDLIPNLVEAIKGYTKHEEGTLLKVVEARNAAMQGADTPAAQALSQNMITSALKSVFALSEAYPDLKANTNFLGLQTELSDTENKIQAARRFYNGNVRDLNAAVRMFPGNIIAGMFKFTSREFYDLPDGDAAQENVQVKF